MSDKLVADSSYSGYLGSQGYGEDVPNGALDEAAGSPGGRHVGRRARARVGGHTSAAYQGEVQVRGEGSSRGDVEVDTIIPDHKY